MSSRVALVAPLASTRARLADQATSVVLAVLAAAALGSGCSNASPPPGGMLTAGPSADASGPAAAAPAPSPKPVANASALTRFPAVDVSRLDAAGLQFFTKVANEEICPCDCPKTFGQCLQDGTKCQPAVMLADYIVGMLADGVPGEALQEAITKELTSGFSAAPRTVVVDGFAQRGSAKAPITVVEYADFECAHCRAAAPIVEELVKAHPEVRVVFKHLPLTFHAMAKKAAIAAEAAGRQGKFWEMHGALFATQDLLSDELIRGHAKALGLDVARFEKDLADPALAKKVDDSRAEATALGVDATPAFLVAGRPYFLSRSVDGFALRLKMDAARASASCQ